MRKLTYIFFVVVVIASILYALKVRANRFDWSLGYPVQTDDNITTINGIRYDWVWGQPAITWDEEEGAAPVAGFGDAQNKVKGVEIIKGTGGVK